MKASKQAQRDAKQLFQACLVDGALDEDRARAAVKALAEKKPRGYHGIMAHFQKLVQMDVDKRTANVSSAIALDDNPIKISPTSPQFRRPRRDQPTFIPTSQHRPGPFCKARACPQRLERLAEFWQ